MKHIDFEFNGMVYALSFTAEALFTVYDKFGYTADILGTTSILEPTAEGLEELLLAGGADGFPGRAAAAAPGEDPRPMISMEELRTGFMAAENTRLRLAVRQALEQGFERDVPSPDEDQEVNLVLLEREEMQKTKAAAAAALSSWLGQLLGSTSAQKDALMLTPGMYLDMIEVLRPREEADDGSTYDCD